MGPLAPAFESTFRYVMGIVAFCAVILIFVAGYHLGRRGEDMPKWDYDKDTDEHFIQLPATGMLVIVSDDANWFVYSADRVLAYGEGLSIESAKKDALLGATELLTKSMAVVRGEKPNLPN